MFFFFLLASWKDSFKRTKEAFGQINIVCNNAGIGALSEGAYWERVVDINLVIKGNLSKGDFERHTSTRSGLLTSLCGGFAQIFT